MDLRLRELGACLECWNREGAKNAKIGAKTLRFFAFFAPSRFRLKDELQALAASPAET